MIRLDEKKLSQLKTGSQHFEEKYGPVGSPSRKEFQAKAEAWYYAELLRDERKRQKLTQQELIVPNSITLQHTHLLFYYSYQLIR